MGRGHCNLPGWRWAAITKVALDRLSRSLHSDVCDSDGCCDAVVHSTISGSGNRRTRAVPNNLIKQPFETKSIGRSSLRGAYTSKFLKCMTLASVLKRCRQLRASLNVASLRKGQ